MIVVDKYVSIEVTDSAYKLKSYIDNRGYVAPIYVIALKTEGSIFSAIQRHLAHIDKYVGSGKCTLLDMSSDRVREASYTLHTYSARVRSSTSATWAYAV